MKLAMVGVAAFVVGIAGGTFLSPARNAVPVDTAHVAEDEHAEGGDSTAVNDPGHAAPVAVGDSAVAHEGPIADGHDAAAGGGADEIHSISAAVAKLPATDAGPMVARLPEADALAVLKSLPLSQASKILDQMPADIAARLSKQLLLAGATP